MRIAICEDEQVHIEILSGYIDDWAKEKGVSISVSRFDSAEAFMFNWTESNTFDLAFLDIQMRQMNGMTLAKHIRQTDQGMLIIFTSGLKDFVVRGYEVQAFRFILKPVRAAVCYQALTASYSLYKTRNEDTFLILRETESLRLFKYEIYYFAMDNHYVTAHTTRGVIKYKQKISLLVDQLGEPHFCLCHRSYLVNLHHVDAIAREAVTMANGDKLPISRSRWDALNKCFINYYSGKRGNQHALDS